MCLAFTENAINTDKCQEMLSQHYIIKKWESPSFTLGSILGNECTLFFTPFFLVISIEWLYKAQTNR